jgi:hypothetical protein
MINRISLSRNELRFAWNLPKRLRPRGAYAPTRRGYDAASRSAPPSRGAVRMRFPTGTAFSRLDYAHVLSRSSPDVQ